MLNVSQTLNRFRHRATFVATALGLKHKGFFTPYAYSGTFAENTSEYECVRPLFEKRIAEFEQFIRRLSFYEPYFEAISDDPAGPPWNARMFSTMDAAVLYAMVADLRPRRIVEIGSGTSTLFAARAIGDHAIRCDMLCIDPSPRADISRLPITFDRRTLSGAHREAVEALGAGDILFVDNSHILQEGSDVDIVFNRFLPVLAPGVIVHVHDVFLPYPYPQQWRLFRWNEQTALIPWLLSGAFKMVFASHFAWRRLRQQIESATERFQLYRPDNGGSLWLRKT